VPKIIKVGGNQSYGKNNFAQFFFETLYVG